MKLRAVIFDIGGVLIRTDDFRLHRVWEERLGLEQGGLIKAVFQSQICAQASRGEVLVADVWRSVGASLGLSDSQTRHLKRDFWRHDQLDGTLVAMLRGLRPQYRTALLSNAWHGARAMLSHSRRCALSDAVDVIVLSSEEGIAKPDPRIYALSAARLGVAPCETVFVDDFLVNVEAARALGMCALHFRSTAQIMAELEHVLYRSASVDARPHLCEAARGG